MDYSRLRRRPFLLSLPPSGEKPLSRERLQPSERLRPSELLRRAALLLSLVLPLAGCTSEDPPGEASASDVRQHAGALTQAQIRTINFELLSDWQVWSGSGTLASSNQAIEGQHSLAVSGIGFAGVRNVTPLTKDDKQTPEVVGYDIWLPPQSPNPQWTGDTQLIVDAPSAGVYQQYLGYRSFAGLPRGQWVRVEFPVPNWIRQALDGANYTDLRFVIAINAPQGSQTHYLDRFTLGPVPTTCTPVDDGNPCTADECDPSTGQTSHVPLAPDALCSDGNACNGLEVCDGAGTCTPGTAPTVDDGNACTADTCDPTNGVSHTPAPAGTACSDGNACNGAELCDAAGTCQAGTAPTVDDGNPCTADTCDPTTGVSHEPLAAGTTCADSDVCNGAEACDGAGSCASGSPLVVDDGNPCTADSCDPLEGVIHLPVNAGVACGDGNACNGAELCDGSGSCLVGTAPAADDGNPCTADSCDPLEGVIHLPVGAGVACADADACNGAETCDGAGTCVSGTPVNTDDGNACTLGSCDPATGAVTQTPAPVDSPCGDGDACNGAEFCSASGVCQAGTAPELDDNNPCTADSCDPLFGVDHSPTPAGSSCADSTVCNGAELCDGAGSCSPGVLLALDDGNSCTTDSCDPTAGVSHEPLGDGSGCNDGNACTTTDSCQAGACVGSAPIQCGALDSCHDAGVCDPATGLCSDPPKPDGAACDDGVSCTAGDTCQAGACVAGAAPSLEQAPCQVATCDAESGGVVYTQAPEGTACQPDACSQGSCTAAGECLVTSSTVVDDGDPCTVDFCDPILGPTHAACAKIDPTVATTVLSSTSWLYTGLFPVQTGVDPADIEERRAALLSGSVTTRAGEAIPSVKVSVNGHPEFGETLTQADGTFDMVVNGGGTLQVQFHKAGYLDSARRIDPRWNQTHQVDPVILIPPDPAVTEVILDDAGTEFQVAQGSAITDDDGTRQATLLFPPGVQATMRLADGTEQLLHTLHVRATEFTVGPEGPDSMPASLPSNTGYTYAFEANADEAVAAGAPEITFSEPVPFYVENFLHFPVGEVVPLGSYDREQGLWIPHDNGIIVEVVSITNGAATLDVTGDGAADPDGVLATHGITPEELTQLATLYAPGTSLWRVKLPHFTQPFDTNWPIKFPGDAEIPAATPEPTSRGKEKGPKPDKQCHASTVACQSQIFQETVGLAGTSVALAYSSARVPGRTADRTVDIPLAGPTIPASLKRIELKVQIAGRTFRESYPATANTKTSFTWDGLDAFGQQVQGSKQAVITVSYIYEGVYTSSFRFNQPGPGVMLGGDISRQEMSASRSWTVPIGSWNNAAAGLGGWSLTNHHSYDAAGGQLLLGDGSQLSAAATGTVVETLHPSSGNDVIAAAPDGSVYTCLANGNSNKLYRVAPDGTMTHVAGHDVFNDRYSGDGGPATEAGIACQGGSLAVGANGDVYLAAADSEPRVRRISTDGVITTVAGTGQRGYTGDSGPATEATLDGVHGVAVSADGDLFIGHSNPLLYPAGGLVRKVSPDGIITTIHATSAQVADVSVDPANGLVYVAVGTQPVQVFTIDAAATVTHVFGCQGASCVSGDYATQDVPALGFYGYANSPWPKIAIDQEGRLYVRSYVANYKGSAAAGTVWRVDWDGIVRPIVGHLGSVPFFDGVLAAQTSFTVTDMDFVGDYMVASYNKQVGGGSLRIHQAYPELGLNDAVVPAPNGTELFVFDGTGRHLQTRHRLTQKVLASYEYDQNGLLVKVLDAQGLATTIERTSDGTPVAIVAPYGQRTELSLGADGYLDEIAKPEGQTYAMQYHPGGLMSDFRDPTGGSSHMTYDALGRIAVDQDRNGGTLSLSRSDNGVGSWSINRTSALGQATTYSVELLPDGSQERTNTYPDGTSSTMSWSPTATTSTLSDGTVSVVTQAADPLFSTMSPVSSSKTTLPSGLSQTVANSRAVTLADPSLLASLTSQTDTTVVSGKTYKTQFTKSDLRFRSTTPVGRITDEFIDEFGRMVRLKSPGAPTVRTQYTAEKVTAIIIDPDGIAGNADDRTTTMSYDASGRLTAVTDPLTHVTAFTNYDQADRPGTITLPDSSEVNMTYDIEGNVATVTPPGKEAHAMTYGIWGRIESYTPPVGNAVTYQYDLDRHVDLIDFGSDALGIPHQVDFTWDHPTGQLQSITSPTGTIDVGYTQGKMTSLISPSLSGPITTNIAYDGPLPTALGWSGPVAGQVSWTYNDRFLIDTETIGALPSTTVNYTYDNDGLVTQAGALTIARDPASGRVTSKTIGNIRERFQYNEFAELSRQTVELMSGTTVVETLYDVIYDDNGVNGDRDALGRITKKTESIVQGDTPGSTARPLASKIYDYGYNAAGRPWLESVSVDGSVVSSYGYDANGNRTSAELSWSQLGYDASFDVSLSEVDTEYNEADQLLTYGDTTYEWNNFGQLASKTDTSTGETTFYEYDLYGNLLSVALPDGRTIEYDVDGAGRRVGRRVLDSQGTEIEFRGWIFRDDQRPIAEVDASGNVIVRYVYRGRIAPEYVVHFDQPVPVVYRLIKDQVGSVVLTIDVATGAVAGSARDPFGAHPDGPSELHPFGFAGGLIDFDTGLVRLGVRDYDPSVGRWTTRDPILFAGQDTNLFAYVENDPVNYIDAWGLMKLPASPDGLGDEWVPDPSHKDPNGSRYRHPSGEYLDFHKGRPGKAGWRAKDHWHDSRDPRPHRSPGDEVPDFDLVCQEPNQSFGPSQDDREPEAPQKRESYPWEEFFPNGTIPFFPIFPVPIPGGAPSPVPFPVPAPI